MFKLTHPNNLRSRNRFLFKEEFYSICSRHQYPKDDCNMCNSGQWCNIYIRVVDHFIHEHFKFLFF